MAATHDNVLGVLSLILWSLIVVVTLKYHVYVLRFDNRGEGGILALLGLVQPSLTSPRGRLLASTIGLFGAALLYGDGMITPAISVLSAVEGLSVATTFFEPYILPITLVILVGLFLIQERGTAGIGTLFGPVMVVWFATIATLGGAAILRQPAVLAALDPRHGLHFLLAHGMHGFLVLGAVFLVTTGGEALYADMGHFGETPIQIDWFGLVGPSLLLNYFGQGALLLENPEAAHNPFYRLAPAWALYPLVGLATFATIIASQAIISGAFSLTRQAIQLGYLPRMAIVHTSFTEIGQIYVPAVNWALMLATLGLVLGFRTSSSLAAAYGVAVTTTMVVTTLLAHVAARRRLGWSMAFAGFVTGTFLVIDLAFFGSNMVKLVQGGWFPLLVGALVFVLMTTWRRGRVTLAARMRERAQPLARFLEDVKAAPPLRVPGTAVFMAGTPEGVPPALLHNLRHNLVLHEDVVFLTVTTEERPRVPPDERMSVEDLGDGLYRVYVRYGFMEDPDIPGVLGTVKVPGLALDPAETTFFLGRETILAGDRPGMIPWRARLYALMARNARSATSFFRLPAERVVELGSQIEL